jgi:Zn-finger nucleic acid-binding protein
MDCPKCHGHFEHISTPAGVVERCSTCHGLWFDVMEHKELKDFAAALDTGDKKMGSLYSEISDIQCPVCPNIKMLEMTDSAQRHIHFESCPQCHGRFYDAGEYVDYATISVSDFLKRFGLRK